MKKLYLTIIIICSTSLFSVSELSLKGGINFSLDRDLVWAPVLTNTLTPIGAVSYTGGNTNGFHKVNTYFTMGDVNSSISKLPLSGWNGGESWYRDDPFVASKIDYTYYGRLGEERGFSFYIGVGVKLDLKLVFSHYTFFNTATTVNLGFYMDKEVNDHKFSGSIMIPVITYLNRPPYVGCSNEIIEKASNPADLLVMGRLTSLWEFFNIDLNLGYKYSLTENINIDSEINLEYTYVNSPRERWFLDSSLLAGVAYDFDGGKE